MSLGDNLHRDRYLVKEIQKYIQGEYVYIPSHAGKRKRLGENLKAEII